MLAGFHLVAVGCVGVFYLGTVCSEGFYVMLGEVALVGGNLGGGPCSNPKHNNLFVKTL